MGSISALQTACEDVNTVNCIHALLDTAAQMGCRTPLEQIVQVAHIHSALCSCRQHDYFRAREHSQNHISGCFKDSQRQTVWDGGNASRKTWHFSSCAYTTFYEQNILTQKCMKEWPQSKQHWRSLILGKCRSFLGTGQTLPFAFWGEGDGKEVTIMTCISLLAPLS